jgi:pimeloyl-ACP methyl ester carboxylesterase
MLVLLLVLTPKQVFASSYDQTVNNSFNLISGNGGNDSFAVLVTDPNFVLKKIAFEVQFIQKDTPEFIQTNCPNYDQFLSMEIGNGFIDNVFPFYHNPIGDNQKKIIEFDVSGLNLTPAKLAEYRFYISHSVSNTLNCSPSQFGEQVSSGNISNSYVSSWQKNPTLTPFVKFNSDVNSKTPVLIVPGIMGTEIDSGQTILWPDISKMFSSSGDSFMDQLSFNKTGPIDSNLVVSNVLGQPSRFFDYTKALTDSFISLGYTKDKDLFLFPYDWRRDLHDVAVTDDPQLKNLSLKQIIEQIASTTGSSKLDIVAHSQGGLVVKRLLYEKPEYQDKINKLVFVGTPNLGAPKATKALLYGDSMDVSFLGMGLDPEEVKNIGHNMPAVYELMPSQEYFNHSDGYLGSTQSAWTSLLGLGNVLNYSSSKTLLSDKGLNTELINQAESFHAYDNFMPTVSKLYNIVGCQTGTMDKIFVRGENESPLLKYGPGDGTVPEFSADHLSNATTFYALDSSHGTMLTQDGIRQQIVNIIAGANLSTKGNITPFLSDCHFNGRQVAVHSPVDLHIYDEQNNHVGPNSEGQIDLDIPGVQYDIVGHEKFAFLPPGHTYKVKLIATDAGSFSFDSTVISDNHVVNTAHYDSVPITPTSTADILLNPDNNQTINFTSDNRIVAPSSILNENESQDIIPPVSTSTITGLVGQPGFYRGDVSVSLSATDPVIPNHELETSGVLATYYKLDGDTTYKTYIGPISPIGEGTHVLKFYSTDKAGNKELEKTITFTVDKTAPEISVSFSPAAKDYIFTSNDDQDANPQLICGAVQCTSTDKAGNLLVLNFQKQLLPLNVKNLIFKSASYNAQNFSFDPNLLTVGFTLSGGNISGLSQTELIKNQQILNITYNLKQNQSVISDFSKGSKPQITTATGIKILQISTVSGKIKITIK